MPPTKEVGEDQNTNTRTSVVQMAFKLHIHSKFQKTARVYTPVLIQIKHYKEIKSQSGIRRQQIQRPSDKSDQELYKGGYHCPRALLVSYRSISYKSVTLP